MKTLFLSILLLFLAQHEMAAQTEFNLKASETMLMTGKGPGQDATINPYAGEDCYAIVENNGKRAFSIRIQQQGKILEIIPVKKGELKKVKLLQGQELYVDGNAEKAVKAKVSYAKLES